MNRIIEILEALNKEYPVRNGRDHFFIMRGGKAIFNIYVKGTLHHVAPDINGIDEVPTHIFMDSFNNYINGSK